MTVIVVQGERSFPVPESASPSSSPTHSHRAGGYLDSFPLPSRSSSLLLFYLRAVLLWAGSGQKSAAPGGLRSCRIIAQRALGSGQCADPTFL